MKKVFKTVLFFVMFSCGIFIYALIWGRPFSINHYFDRTLIKILMDEPQMLSSLGLIDNTILDFHSDELSDASDERTLEFIAQAEKELETLRSYYYEGLNRSQKLSYKIAEWMLTKSLEGKQFIYHSYPVNQISGIQNELPSFMDATHQIIDEKSARRYAIRLSQFGRVFDQTVEMLKVREDRNIVPPRFVLVNVIAQMSDFIAVSPEGNILFTSFTKKLADVESLNPPIKHKLETKVLDEIEKTVYPAYSKMIDYLRHLESVATTDDGAWKLPNGDAFYRFMLSMATTTNMTPDEIHELGLSEVYRIQKEMRSILDSLGHTGGTVGEWMQSLSEESRFLFPDSDSGRAAIISTYEEIIREIDEALGTAFDLRPRAKVEVKRIPEFKEQTSAGAYYNQPAMDGSRPGVFYANLRDVKEIPSFGMRTLAYHEAIPGHHYQLALQLEMEGVPLFRRFPPFMAYVEGWALYAERVAAEYGFHTDPYSNLGRLQGELFRAVRLVVDTGIHHKRWTREEAINYMYDNTGIPRSDVISEIERYIVWPGQACAYKIGMEKILDVRSSALTKLGDQFDIREFHTTVLENGAVPLEILDQIVHDYVVEKMKGS